MRTSIGFALLFFTSFAPAVADDDAQMALKNHTTVAVIKLARGQIFEAHSSCFDRAADRGKFDHKQGDGSYAWMIEDNGKMLIKGDDLMLQNGFGAFRKVTYFCEWDLKARKITGMGVKPT